MVTEPLGIFSFIRVPVNLTPTPTVGIWDDWLSIISDHSYIWETPSNCHLVEFQKNQASGGGIAVLRASRVLESIYSYDLFLELENGKLLNTKVSW